MQIQKQAFSPRAQGAAPPGILDCLCCAAVTLAAGNGLRGHLRFACAVDILCVVKAWKDRPRGGAFSRAVRGEQQFPVLELPVLSPAFLSPRSTRAVGFSASSRHAWHVHPKGMGQPFLRPPRL